MNKKHQSPEFQIIVQDQANAKFFVASFMNGPKGAQVLTPPSNIPNITGSKASSYGADEDGFTF